MFSALKRLTSRSEVNGGPNVGGGVTTMSSSLQKKFSKGVQYNMKIILKGDKNVGKTSVFRRLQGLPFVEEYTQTEEIQAASIQWNYKTTDDVIKVDVWEIVDKASKKKSLPNKLKIENSQLKGEDADTVQEIGLDASFLDVYKNTNGVIFVLDITKGWTFDYVKREINTVPLHIPILILGNHRDMGHHRAVAADSVHYFIESLERSNVRYAESSMRNTFGLKYIHKFFNLPFLQLQRETLLKQLETNSEENQVTLKELDYYADSDDSNYDLFIEGLSQKRRAMADAVAPPKMSFAEAQAIAAEKAMKEGNVAAAVALASKPSIIDPSQEVKSKPNVPTIASTLQESAASNLTSTSSIVAGVAASSFQESNNKIPSSASTSSLKSKSNGGDSHANNSSNSTNSNTNNKITANGNSQQHQQQQSSASTNNNSSITNNIAPIDDFVPDEANVIDKSFFMEESSTPSRSSNNNNKNKYPEREFETSEEEDEVGNTGGLNPLVANFEEDVVPERYNSPIFIPPTTTSANATKIANGDNATVFVNKSVENPPPPPAPTASKFCILSSSDEEDQDQEEEQEEKLKKSKSNKSSTVQFLDEGTEGSNFNFNLNLADLPQSNMELDLGIFLKDDDVDDDKNFNANDVLTEFASPNSSSSKHHHTSSSSSGKDKEKKSSKKSSSSSSSSSKHHKKSSKHKSKSGSSSKKEKDRHQLDLDDFLNGPSSSSPNNNPEDLDLNAYEAL